MADTISQRIVRSRVWRVIAFVLTPAYLLSERAQREQIADIFGEPRDPNDRARWFEVLTLGFVKRKYVRPTAAFAATSSGH